jgi:DNA-binding SARP family transcriptional activator
MLTIRLLGAPAIERDGEPVRSPRGRKAWAMLAYLMLADRPPSRQRLAELLFADADDPLGALRWTLAELRRALSRRDVFGGDPVSTELGPDVDVDVRRMTDDPADPAPLLEVAGELLEGVHLAASPEFESWLLVERHRVSATLEARLRQEAVALLAANRATEAVRYAARAVAHNPLEEGNHELLVRSLAMAGDRPAALAQIAVCEDILRREIGIQASPALRDAASASPGSPRMPALRGRAAAANQLEAGRAAIIAGAVDVGLQSLRSAVAESLRAKDFPLHVRALAALGAALVHAVRGRDEEGAVVLHEALRLTHESGDRATAVLAQRELGFIEVHAGRRRTAESWLTKAQAIAETDEEHAAVLAIRGMNASDMGDYPAAFVHLGQSTERAARAGDSRQVAWSQSVLARAHLLRDERSQAAAALRRSLELVRQQRWMAFQPWPQTWLAEIDRLAGDLESAGDRLEQAWVMACQLNDPCWEGMAARGLGVLNSGRGDHTAAGEWFGEAATRCNRVPDRYQWVHAYVLDAIAGDAIDRGDHDRARAVATTLSSLAARTEMREMLVRAELHKHRLGDGTAFVAAQVLAAGIDNPALTELMRNSK